MPTVFVKLAEKTKLRLNRLAASDASTSYAFMVDAIESALSNSENHSVFVADALRSRKQVFASGQLIDGPALSDYLTAKARRLKADRPKPVRVESMLSHANRTWPSRWASSGHPRQQS